MMEERDLATGDEVGCEPEQLAEITDFMERFVAAWQLSVTPEVFIDRDALVIDFSGPDEDLLLERRAEVLEALQLLLGRILPTHFRAQCRVLVDSGRCKLGREHEVIEIAHRTAERVKKFGEACLLSPMNPHERRLVHLALRDDAAVTTSSDGEGFMKRVRILPNRGPI